MRLIHLALLPLIASAATVPCPQGNVPVTFSNCQVTSTVSAGLAPMNIVLNLLFFDSAASEVGATLTGPYRLDDVRGTPQSATETLTFDYSVRSDYRVTGIRLASTATSGFSNDLSEFVSLDAPCERFIDENTSFVVTCFGPDVESARSVAMRFHVRSDGCIAGSCHTGFVDGGAFTISLAQVPEPGTWAMGLTGLSLLGVGRWRWSRLMRRDHA